MSEIRSNTDDTRAGKGLTKLSDDALEDVDGGTGEIEDMGDGWYEVTFTCDFCRKYKENIGTLSNDMQAVIGGVFKCPNCGWKRNYEIRPNGGNMGYYMMIWK